MNPQRRVDLHLHTRCSDGGLSPEQLVASADGVLSCISICDHDTLAAYQQLQIPPTLQLLPGVEMSCQLEQHDVHLLAYFPDGLNTSIHQWVQTLEDDRRQRVMGGVERLRESGIPLRIKCLEEELAGAVPCRSHVARALVRQGLAPSTRPLYKRWLSGDRFDRPCLDYRQALEVVHSFGGLVFWAHPAPVHIKQVGRAIVAAGLDGVETLSRNASPAARKSVREFQQEHQLGCSGGSDLHFETPKRRVGSYGVDEDRIDPRLLRLACRS